MFDRRIEKTRLNRRSIAAKQREENGAEGLQRSPSAGNPCGICRDPLLRGMLSERPRIRHGVGPSFLVFLRSPQQRSISWRLRLRDTVSRSNARRMPSRTQRRLDLLAVLWQKLTLENEGGFCEGSAVWGPGFDNLS